MAAAGLVSIHHAQAAANIVLWDTLSPLADTTDLVSSAGWKPVPTDLFTLEADPPKAASDPGYYGREYAFKGDAVVVNQHLVVTFLSAKGRVVLYSKDGAASPTSTAPGRKILEFAPLQTKNQPMTINRCAVLRNARDEVALEVSFSAAGSADVSAVLAFDKGEIVEVRPGKNMRGMSLATRMDYGVVPSFIGDDLIFAPSNYSSVDALAVPSENVFLGLVEGENDMLVATWPKGQQRLNLKLGKEQQGRRLIEEIAFDNDGQSLYLAALRAPGIWHREELKPAYLEKDVPIRWKKPFPAKWATQLSEGGVMTTFTFREAKAQIWRGVPGSYNYPVWFDGETAFYHLSKKVPPKGESIVYFREGENTPLSVSTPVDIMKATLGRPMCDALLDIPGRKLRTHHRRGGDGVRRACTCGCTEAIQAVFEAGQEVEKQEYVAKALDDMIYFVSQHMERIDEYRHFADEMIALLKARGSTAPDLRPFTDSLEQIVQQIPQECDVQKDNMKSLAHANELSRKTMALTAKKDPQNVPAYMALLKAWRDMGGAQDYIVAQCHTITRKLCQEAGYGCATQPKAAAFAEEIRKRCKQCLRNPDGYEIWPNY